jgi:SAM-dependent methyltransferase
MSTETESHLDFYKRWHRLTKAYIRWQFEQFRPFLGRRIADIGCGLGNFTEHLLDRDFYLGIDLDQELLHELENEYAHRGPVKTTRLDLTSPELVPTLIASSVDTTLCVNVIEHVENDRLAVQNMVEALPSGGHLCLLVPALPFLFGTLDDLDGHYRRYTKEVLAHRFDGLPGKIVRLYYFNFAGIPGWFIKGRILKQKTHTDDNYALMKVVLPIVKPLERLLPPPIGMSLIAIFRKD